MSGLHAAFEERLGSAGFEAYADSDDGLGSIMARIEAARLPVIAAINGYAVSGGLEAALCCDVRLAATHAQFACSGVNVGLILSWFRLPRVVGLGRAEEMLLSGAMYDAEQAERWGLVTGLHDPDKLVPAALALAEQIATRAPLSVEATEGVRQHGFDLSIAEAMARQRERSATFKRR
jgi:enoyl-CoA hydratase